ncbi:hypothetical protein BCR39DRAFT_537847 [Naematelia encephala]|uniref:Uncharacterized protein n=1 Tax=Naematelia encephala TaxID=71784 RepID=A0A1Y2AYM0_9TREE|nr:hypothetical protein BCR39DRAFT_537847 [Naematelia encephala]
MYGGHWSPQSMYGMMSPYYAGGLGIPYLSGMGGYGMGGMYGINPTMYGMGLGGLGMGGLGIGSMGYPYGMMMSNPYMYSGMYGVPF